MLLSFFEHLRSYSVPVSLREFIDLLAIFEKRLIFADQVDFYFHCRLALVKDEKYYDRFDRAFASYFEGLHDWQAIFSPEEEEQDLIEVLKQVTRISPEDMERSLEDYEKEVSDLLAKQGSSAKGESDDAADGGEGSPEDGEGEGGEEGEGGNPEENGDHGEGESGEEGEGEEGKGTDGKIGEGESDEGEEGEKDEASEKSARRATKIWLRREFEDYDPDVELGTRNLKMALRRLRRWVREASDLELDLIDTINSTARNGGILDIKEVPERHNAVKVLMFLDVGGSMDDHVELCAQLFSAASSEFKYLSYYYFHNFLYESVWTDNERRLEDKLSVMRLLQTYGRDYKVIFVGDADMGRHEITERGGSVEHFNAEPGEVWFQRVLDQFRHVVWLNPVPESRWHDSFSIQMVKRRVDNHMYFLSDNGIEAAMKHLMR